MVGEYILKDFESLFILECIRHEFTSPYTPQHNALAERRNKTTLDMASNILKHVSLPHMFREK